MELSPKAIDNYGAQKAVCLTIGKDSTCTPLRRHQLSGSPSV